MVEDGKTTATYPAVSSSALGGYWTPDGCTVSDQILNAAIGFGGDGAVYAARERRCERDKQLPPPGR